MLVIILGISDGLAPEAAASLDTRVKSLSAFLGLRKGESGLISARIALT